MKNTIKISVVTLLAVLLLTSCGDKKNTENVSIKENVTVSKTIVANDDVKEEKMMDKDMMGDDMMGDHEGDMMMDDKEEVVTEKIEIKEKIIAEKVETKEKMNVEIVEIKEEVVPVMAKGTYEDYSADKVANASGNIVLFFHATWCPSCNSADKNLKADTIPDNLSIYKINYDTAGDLRKKYGVVTQHTFVQIDNKGNKINKFVGGRSAADIVELLK